MTFIFLLESTEENNCNRPGTENVAASLTVLISSIAGILSNGLVIGSYFYCSYLRDQPGNCFVMSLALTDFLNAVYIQAPCLIYLAKPKLYFNETSCAIYSIFMWSIMTASNWLLAVISIDRSIAINLPLQYHNIVTRPRVRYVYLIFLHKYLLM